MNEFAAESDHWYFPDGKPCHTIIGKNGKERNTTLADARKLGLFPSVSKIKSVLSAPGLVVWGQGQLLSAAYKMPPIENELESEYISRIKSVAADESARVKERGSALHTDIERAIQGKPHTQHQKHVQAIVEALSGIGVNLYEGEAEKSFAAKALGYGGKVDFHSPVIDFKSKDKIEEGKKLAYDEHVIQLAAYQVGLGLPEGPAYSVFVGVDDAKVVVHEWAVEEIKRGWRMFQPMLELWKEQNRYV